MKKLISGAVVLGFAAITLSAGSAMAGDAAAGQAVFEKKCATCHDLGDKKKMGPGLKGATDRHKDDAWLTSWISDPQATWDAAAPETEALKASQNKTGKPKTAMKVKGLSADDVANVIAFLKKNDGK
ncbi:MAG: c-type cytochrome [Nitrospinae bacterium]|nr:c-type cytochrome [Nitrospinota bacterium]